MRYIEKIRRTNLSIVDTEEGHVFDRWGWWLTVYRSEFVTRGVRFGHGEWMVQAEIKHP